MTRFARLAPRLALTLALLPVTAPAMEADDLAALDRDAFLVAMEREHVAYKEAQALLLTRVDPSLGALLPEPAWDAADREAAGCYYDTVAEKGGTHLLARTVAGYRVTAERIAADESLDMARLMRERKRPQDLDASGVSEHDRGVLKSIARTCGFDRPTPAEREAQKQLMAKIMMIGMRSRAE